jgi:hypothetical protein
VIAAADSVLFDPAVLQGSATMGTVPVEDADLALLVAEDHEFFA